MKSFVCRLGTLLMVQAVILVVLVHHHDESEGYFAAFAQKETALRTVAGPRMIFVGGSNVAFGVDSLTIAPRFGYQPVNLGLHAAQGSELMLRQAVSGARAGDVVVVMMEYEHFSDEDLDAMALWSTVLQDPRALGFMGTRSLSRFLDGGLIGMGHLVRHAWQRHVSTPPPLHAAYQRSTFSAAGDAMAHRGLESTGLPPPGLLRAKLSDAFIATLRGSQAAFQALGARMYCLHPAIAASAFQANSVAIARLSAEARASEACVFLDEPAEAVMEDGLFFDTAYHPSGAGVAKNAERIVSSLATVLPIKEAPRP